MEDSEIVVCEIAVVGVVRQVRVVDATSGAIWVESLRVSGLPHTDMSAELPALGEVSILWM